MFGVGCAARVVGATARPAGGRDSRTEPGGSTAASTSFRAITSACVGVDHRSVSTPAATARPTATTSATARRARLRAATSADVRNRAGSPRPGRAALKSNKLPFIFDDPYQNASSAPVLLIALVGGNPPQIDGSARTGCHYACPPGWARGDESRDPPLVCGLSGGSGDEGGDDVGGVGVEGDPGPVVGASSSAGRRGWPPVVRPGAGRRHPGRR